MKSLRTILREANTRGVAVGHFNISNIEGLWAIFRAARKLKLPVIVGTSEGEAAFVGRQQAVALVRSLREQYNFPIFINADHTYTVKGVKEAIDAGYDSVIFDGAKLSLAENIKRTKECVKYARRQKHDVLVEGELGYIGKSSKLLDAIPEGAGDVMTSVTDAKRYVRESGVDALAPSVGNLHGMLKHAKNPRLNIERIKEIKRAVKKPLVLHGGSGISNRDFTAAIKAGIDVVHINTEIRKAFKDSLVKSLKKNKEEIAPYKIMDATIDAMQKVIEQRLKLFAGKK